MYAKTYSFITLKPLRSICINKKEMTRDSSEHRLNTRDSKGNYFLKLFLVSHLLSENYHLKVKMN